MTYQSDLMRAETLALAEMIHRIERRRDDSFNLQSIMNPAWLLYLTLFIAHTEGTAPSTRTLQAANMMGLSEAIDGVEALITAGLATHDSLSSWTPDTPVRLTAQGVDKLNQFLHLNLD